MNEKREVTLVFPLATPSQNQWDKWHFGKQTKWKNDARLILRGAMNSAPGGRASMPLGARNRKHSVAVQTPDGVVSVIREGVRVEGTIQRYGYRTMDRENIVGGFKGLLDVMRSEGLIVDDGPDWWRGTYPEGVVDRKNQRTEITLRWVVPAAPELPQTHSQKRKRGNRTMFELEKHPVDVRKLEVRESKKGDKGQDLVEVRVHLSLYELKPDDLPMLGDAVTAIVKTSADVEEGPDTVDMSIKRSWPHCNYELRLEGSKRFCAKFAGAPVNRPKVSCVDGKVSLHWTIQDPTLSLEHLKNVCKCVAVGGVLLSAQQRQNELDFEEEAAA